jgi:hypothetical protein
MKPVVTEVLSDEDLWHGLKADVEYGKRCARAVEMRGREIRILNNQIAKLEIGRCSESYDNQK